MVWGGGSRPQAFGSKVKQTEEDLQLPLAMPPGRRDVGLAGGPVLTWTNQASYNIV